LTHSAFAFGGGQAFELPGFGKLRKYTPGS